MTLLRRRSPQEPGKSASSRARHSLLSGMVTFAYFHQQFFRDCVRGQKGADVQQFGGYWTGLFDSGKGERPGGGYRIGMRGGDSSSAREHPGTLTLIVLPVIWQAALRLFNICARLIQDKRQSLELLGELAGYAYIFRAGRCQRGARRYLACAAQEQERSCFFLQC